MCLGGIRRLGFMGEFPDDWYWDRGIVLILCRLAYGLPRRYHEWLCGGEVSNTPFMVSRDALFISKEEFVRTDGGVVG